MTRAPIRRSNRHLDRSELRLRHPQVLRLAARHLSAQFGIAEQCRSALLRADLCRLALREQLVLAHPAMSARNIERHHDPVAWLDVLHRTAHFFDNIHWLVAQNVAFLQERTEQFVQVQTSRLPCQ